MKEIPKEVVELAKKIGSNKIIFEGYYRGREAYSFGYIDEYGGIMPTGLPTIALWDGVSMEIIQGMESFDVYSEIIR